MKSIYTALAITALSLTLVGVGVASFAHNSSPAVKEALLKGDFNGYKTAIVDSAKKQSDSLTQDKFNTMSTEAIAREATQKAIEEGNYENFKKTADTRLLARITTQAEFDKLVVEAKATKLIQDKINQSIKDNNYEAYKAAQLEMKTARDANKPVNDKGGKRGDYTPTEADMKSRFDSMVVAYKADGSLPSNQGFDRGGRGHMKR
jgi:hypothetical protein